VTPLEYRRFALRIRGILRKEASEMRVENTEIHSPIFSLSCVDILKNVINRCGNWC